MNQISKVLGVFILISTVACGGGGGGDPEPPANQPPNAQGPASFSAVESTTVTLNGSASSDSDGSIASYVWSQTAGTPDVTLNNANTATANFTAPDVSADTQLTFQLTVTDDDGATDSMTVVVTITVDQAPSAVAPNDFDAVGGSAVNLDGSGSSDDVGITSYLWEQTSGDAVTITNASSAMASFTAPAFDPNNAIMLEFSLTVTDVNGASDSDLVVVTIVDMVTEVTLSGNLTYDLVPHNTSTNGLDYNSITQAPIRGATVELLNAAASTILDTTTSDVSGDYSFVVTPSTNYIVRVKAELKQQGSLPNWDFTVVDNTSGQAIYAMQSAMQQVGTTSATLNMNASSGWTGSSYGSPRMAAPFAILESVYLAKEKIIGVDPDVDFTALKLNWSINNVAVGGDPTQGQIGTSSFNGTEIFILGDADADTDEYDGHVIIHEWGHYFEGRLSRSDSVGGAHSGSDKLDMRVAMGEGFGNALSGIVTDDPFYRDSFGSSQSQGFDINVETNPSSNQGWFSEFSVQSLLYDMYDATNDGSDNLTLGFAPIYEALVNGEKDTAAMTSIFSMATQIKIESPSNASAIDTLLATQSIIAADDFGTTETNNGGDARNLPIYKSITVGGASVEVCSFGTNGQQNKLGNRQFIEFDISATQTYNFTATGQSAGDDPDFVVYQQGTAVFAGEATGNESTSRNLSAGKYIMEVYEFSNIQGTAKDTCIDVTIN